MRIRQVKPDFFIDAVVSAWPPAARLFYIGLWTVADDAGWLEWSLPEIGASLFPYETPKRRLVDMTKAAQYLVDSGRLVVHPCGCANIPTLPTHQRVAGNQSFRARDRHRSLHVATGSTPVAPEVVGNGRERNVEERNGTRDARAASSASRGGIRESAQAIIDDPSATPEAKEGARAMLAIRH